MLLRTALLAFVLALATTAVRAGEMTVYKSPLCGCCGAWVEHMEAAGFQVTVKDIEDVDPVKRFLGVPEPLHSCHTAVIDGYTIEGHVPAADVKRLLAEKPDARGLSVPGMPVGSPGMEQGDRKDPFPVVLFGDEGVSVFSRYE